MGIASCTSPFEEVFLLTGQAEPHPQPPALRKTPRTSRHKYHTHAKTMVNAIPSCQFITPTPWKVPPCTARSLCPQTQRGRARNDVPLLAYRIRGHRHQLTLAIVAMMVMVMAIIAVMVFVMMVVRVPSGRMENRQGNNRQGMNSLKRHDLR